MSTLYVITRYDWDGIRDLIGYVTKRKEAVELVDRYKALDDGDSYGFERVRPFSEGTFDDALAKVEAQRAHLEAERKAARKQALAILNSPPEYVRPPTDYMRELAAKLEAQG
jgi:hypothetical protein